MRYFWTVAVVIILALLVNLCVSVGVVNNTARVIAPLSSFIDDNKFIFLVWHSFLYFAIFSGLYLYCNHLITKHNLSAVKSKDRIIFCYLATMIIIILDVIYYLGRAG